jgi:hypothetical protein
MVQAVILSSLMAACVALCLLLVVHLRRTPASNRRDGLGGVRETLQEPAPTLPTAGAAVATPPAVTVPAQLTDVPPTPSAVQNRPRNNGFTRFGRPATVRYRDPASARR